MGNMGTLPISCSIFVDSVGPGRSPVVYGVFFSPFCIRMLKNNAQIGRESIEKPRELPG